MNVVSLAFRDPVLLAKQCATIDVLSDGRLLPAFGIGSPLAPEWQALGMDSKTRGRKADECLEIIHRLWREESVDFDGAFYKLKGVTIAPKPVQSDLPMWIGGSSDAAIRRTARIGTGWQACGDPAAEAGRVVAAIKAAASQAGRSIDEDHYGAGFAFHFGTRDAPNVGRAMDAYAKRTGRDATYAFAIGDAEGFSRASPNMSTLACRKSTGGHLVRERQHKGANDAHRRGHVFHRLLDVADRTCAGAGGPRLRFALGARTLPHSVDAQVALPQRRRSAEEILRRDGPVRGAGCGRGGNQNAAARHRHLPDRSA
jgi:hypothetical protein